MLVKFEGSPLILFLTLSPVDLMTHTSKLPPPYVYHAADDFIRIKAAPDGLKALLIDSGFGVDPDDPDRLVLTVSSDEAKSQVFARLRDLGVCFSVGPNWSPAETFSWLRDRGLLSGRFQEIAWRGPGDWIVREE